MLLGGNNYAFAMRSVYYWESTGYGMGFYGRKKESRMRQIWVVCYILLLMAHPTNPVGRYADANPKLLPNDT